MSSTSATLHHRNRPQFETELWLGRMDTTSFSLLRVFYIVLWVAIVFAVVVLIGPVKRQIQRLSQPVTVRPEISGVVYINGKPISGVQLRIARAEDEQRGCSALPVVAVSDSAGTFRAPARHKPSILVDESQWIPTDVCLTHGRTVIESFLWFVMPGKTDTMRLVCRYPGIQSKLIENHPCYSAP